MGTLSAGPAVVTGSTSGFGLAYARASQRRRHIVITAMGRSADIGKERKAIESDFKVKAIPRRRT